MKIKRYTAPSMREALARVRAEQGADAVILSSRRGEEGIEVIAAVDYDEALFADANRQRSVVSPTMAPAPAPPEPAVAVSRTQPKSAQEQASQRSSRSPKLIPAHFQRLTMSSLPVATVLRDSLPAQLSPQPRPAQPPAPPRSAQLPQPSAPARSSQPAQPARVDANYTAMQRELKDMRQMLESGFAGITWNDKRLREPLKARVLEELSAA